MNGDQNISQGIKNLGAELSKDSDRSVGLLAGSIVETYVTAYLERSVQHYGDMWKNRTHPSGPLGSFAVKIDLLYMFRLISREAHSDLILMKDIRNRFAHDLAVENFDDVSIRDKCRALKLVDKYVIESGAITERLVSHVAGESTFRIGGIGALEELKCPRTRYVWSAKVFAMGLGMRPVGLGGVI